VAFHVLAKPIGPVCNLDCQYCFYLHKTRFFPEGERYRMSDEVLERFVRSYIESQDAPEVNFAWQGGEPTLLGVDFFRRAVALQRDFAPPGKTVQNAFQTNGILLDDEWCAFFKEHDFLVGLSLDGPREIHDKYRVDKHGAPTFEKVMAALRLLQKHQVRVNSLTCVNRYSGSRGAEVYRFLRDEAGFEHLQFIPVVEQVAFETNAPGVRGKWGQIPFCPSKMVSVPTFPTFPGRDPRLLVTPWTVLPEQFGRFLCAVFDEWVRHDVGRVFVQHLEVALALVLGLPSPLCVFARACGQALAIEHDGTLFSCDHFVYPEYRLGNVKEQGLREMAQSAFQRSFGLDKSAKLPGTCRRCEFLALCFGECPKNRLLFGPGGEAGLNYLCPGLKIYFAHVTPVLAAMARELRAGRPAGNVMLALREAEEAKAGRAGGALLRGAKRHPAGARGKRRPR